MPVKRRDMVECQQKSCPVHYWAERGALSSDRCAASKERYFCTIAMILDTDAFDLPLLWIATCKKGTDGLWKEEGR